MYIIHLVYHFKRMMRNKHIVNLLSKNQYSFINVAKLL